MLYYRIILYYYHWCCTVLSLYCTVLVARPTEKEVRQTLLLPSAANWSLRRPPRLDRPEAVAGCRLLSKCSCCRCLCIGWLVRHYMLVLFFAQGAKAYFAWVVFSCPLRNSFLISRHHANIRRWCYGVAPWVDVLEILWRLTEALVAELSVCVALG